ncbi:MAG TPA: response regulator transcription factor [Edaphobacter sp.]
MPSRILIADDHALMLEGLCRLLSNDFDICGTAANGRILVEEAMRLRPDLIVLDVGMPELNGIEAARQLHTHLPETHLVFVTQQLDADYLRAAFQAGARAYVAKQSASTELLEAIRLVLSGSYYISPLIPAPSVDGRMRFDPRNDPSELFHTALTTRQREVLQLIAEGKSTKEISTALRISPKTVEFHKSGLMDGLGMRTTAELTRYALAKGIIGS